MAERFFKNQIINLLKAEILFIALDASGEKKHYAG